MEHSKKFKCRSHVSNFLGPQTTDLEKNTQKVDFGRRQDQYIMSLRRVEAIM